MKTILSFTLFFAFLLSSSAKTIKVIGTFTDFEHKQQKGEFLLPVQYINKEIVHRLVQWRVLFEDGSGQELLLTPENCKGFEFFYKEEWKKFVSVDNVFNWPNPFKESKEKIFLEAKVSGEVSLLSYHGYKHVEEIYMENGSGGGRGMGSGGRIKAQLHFYKNKRLVKFNKSDWRKQLKNLIWRNRELSDLVDQTKRKHLVAFLERYNHQAATQKEL